MNRDLIIQQRVDLRSILPTFSRRNSENGTQWGLGYQGEIKMWPWHNYSFGVAPQVRETNRGGGGQILGRLIGEMTHLSKNTLRSVPQMFETLGFEISGKIYSDSETRVNLNTWFACGVFHVTEDVKFRRNFCFCYSLFLRIENNLWNWKILVPAKVPCNTIVKKAWLSCSSCLQLANVTVTRTHVMLRLESVIVLTVMWLGITAKGKFSRCLQKVSLRLKFFVPKQFYQAFLAVELKDCNRIYSFTDVTTEFVPRWSLVTQQMAVTVTVSYLILLKKDFLLIPNLLSGHARPIYSCL